MLPQRDPLLIAPMAWPQTFTQALAVSVQLILRISKEPCWRMVVASGGWRRTATILFAISLMSQKSTLTALARRLRRTRQRCSRVRRRLDTSAAVPEGICPKRRAMSLAWMVATL